MKALDINFINVFNATRLPKFHKSSFVLSHYDTGRGNCAATEKLLQYF